MWHAVGVRGNLPPNTLVRLTRLLAVRGFVTIMIKIKIMIMNAPEPRPQHFAGDARLLPRRQQQITSPNTLVRITRLLAVRGLIKITIMILNDL